MRARKKVAFSGDKVPRHRWGRGTLRTPPRRCAPSRHAVVVRRYSRQSKDLSGTSKWCQSALNTALSRPRIVLLPAFTLSTYTKRCSVEITAWMLCTKKGFDAVIHSLTRFARLNGIHIRHASERLPVLFGRHGRGATGGFGREWLEKWGYVEEDESAGDSLQHELSKAGDKVQKKSFANKGTGRRDPLGSRGQN